MNQVLLVGRLTQDPEVKELKDGTCRTSLCLAVSRDYKNLEGTVDADFIYCVVWNGIASAAKEYCHKGDLIGISGKLQTRSYEAEEKTHYLMEVIAEKVTYLSHKKVAND